MENVDEYTRQQQNNAKSIQITFLKVMSQVLILPSWRPRFDSHYWQEKNGSLLPDRIDF